jgi:hypothetical protein
MKVITSVYQAENAKYFCDKHPTKECFSELQLSSWYGSKFDLNIVKVHLCDECVKEMYGFLLKEFNVEPEPIDI